mgnify:CR=1 FL=1
MNRSYATTLSLLLLGACITGSMSLDDADAHIAGVDKGLYGFAMTAAQADNDVELDLVVGAPLRGQVYIHTDVAADAVDGQLSADDAFVFTGEPGGEAGWSLAAGELDGNPLYRDLVIAAPVENGGRGRIYVVKGGSVDSDLDAAGWATYVGDDRHEWAGFSVATGDVNGDGHDDLVVGASGWANKTGRVFVVYGPLEQGKGDQELSNADVIIEGDRAGGYFGNALAVADLDHDGQDDIIIGHREADLLGKGALWVVYDASPGTHAVDDLQWAARIDGDSQEGVLGYSLSAGGDVNGDGIADLVVGEPQADCKLHTEEARNILAPSPNCAGRWSETGRAWLILGQKWTRLTDGLVSKKAAAVRKGQDKEGLGWSVTAGGDLNGDGYDDIVVGTNHGHRAQVHYGYTTDTIARAASGTDYDAELVSKEEDYAGQSVAMFDWDVNGDGLDDLFVAAPNQRWYPDAPSDLPGKVYVVFGQPNE